MPFDIGVGETFYITLEGSRYRLQMDPALHEAFESGNDMAVKEHFAHILKPGLGCEAKDITFARTSGTRSFVLILARTGRVVQAPDSVLPPEESFE